MILFANDFDFLKKYTEVIQLVNPSGASVLLAPAWQGRVMTSSYDAEAGPSFGWINRKLIPGGIRPEEEVKGSLEEKIYVFGGEERFWLGPEGGQFSYYFAPEAEFTFENWFTPTAIDTDGFRVEEKSSTHALFSHSAVLVNQSGHKFDMGFLRRVDLLSNEQIAENLKITMVEGIKAVGYQTDNKITNKGDSAWTCLLYTSPSPRDLSTSRMPSSA